MKTRQIRTVNCKEEGGQDGDPSREPTPSVADLGPGGAYLSQTRTLADLGQTHSGEFGPDSQWWTLADLGQTRAFCYNS
jgi:hypothetical protein